MANHKVRKVNEKDLPNKKSKKDKLALKKMISTERHPSAIFELLFFFKKAMQFQCLKVTVMIGGASIEPRGGGQCYSDRSNAISLVSTPAHT